MGQREREHCSFSASPNEAFHLAAACLSGSDATGCNERSRDAGIHRPGGLRRTEPLLGEVHGLTGIDGQAVYLNQISYSPSLAL